jgi:carbon monoxide dehydrogenase subunit G
MLLSEKGNDRYMITLITTAQQIMTGVKSVETEGDRTALVMMVVCGGLMRK